uniref:Fibrillar collagen NC1 domain-containing protein n=2 Tax=Denticeps clupeoides TaxID=299321 RepID=A0AAY4CHS0_9TELE
MNFLHLLSYEAIQHITIHCLNVPVWTTSISKKTSPNSVRFKAWNGQIVEAGGVVAPKILRDDCWLTDGQWHQAQFMFQTQDTGLLPIVDVYNFPTTKPGSHYHLEVGPVCFL